MVENPRPHGEVAAPLKSVGAPCLMTDKKIMGCNAACLAKPKRIVVPTRQGQGVEPQERGEAEQGVSRDTLILRYQTLNWRAEHWRDGTGF